MTESETVFVASNTPTSADTAGATAGGINPSPVVKKTIDDPQALMQALMEQNISGALMLFKDPEWPSQDLTKREHLVLLGIAHGLSNSNIGDGVKISQRTVEIHRKNLIRKLGAINSADAVRIAVKLGMV
jgi:DNA-binding NarL/FixJ family response regulator